MSTLITRYPQLVQYVNTIIKRCSLPIALALVFVYLLSMNNRTTLAQLDKEWELAVMRNARIHLALVFLISDNVRLLQAHSHKKLEEVG